jgi:hypothetical protein
MASSRLSRAIAYTPTTKQPRVNKRAGENVNGAKFRQLRAENARRQASGNRQQRAQVSEMSLLRSLLL